MDNNKDMRSCTIGPHKAVFHKWVEVSEVIYPSPYVVGHEGGRMCDTFALVELEDGTMMKVKPESVTFCTPSVSRFFPKDIKATRFNHVFLQKE